MFARVALLAICGLVIGCGFVRDERPSFGVSNGTTLAIVVTIDSPDGGATVNVAPGGTMELDPSRSPQLPWVVEARTLSGRLLTSMTVLPGQVTRTTRPDGSVEMTGTLGRVDLSCGRLDIWAGAPALGPPPGPGVPGDCEP
jgi:hypothetical protein